jgi:hypothetical protein
MKITQHIQKQSDFIISFAIKIAYPSLYASIYHDRCLCYKLQINCLPKQDHMQYKCLLMFKYMIGIILNLVVIFHTADDRDHQNLYIFVSIWELQFKTI